MARECWSRPRVLVSTYDILEGRVPRDILKVWNDVNCLGRFEGVGTFRSVKIYILEF
jgi:hypothetical protein